MPVHAEFSADLNTKPYEASVKRLEADTSRAARRVSTEWGRTAQATDRLQGRSRGGGIGSGPDRSGAQRWGNMAHQIQDIAVQLEQGASASRVLAQQGSQMASVYGVGGSILGGVIAVGAALWRWYSASKANKAVNEAWAKEEIKRSIDFNKNTRSLEEQAELLKIRVKFGEDYADAVERAWESEKRIQAIKQNGSLRESQKRFALDAEDALYAAQVEYDATKKQAEARKQLHQEDERAAKALREFQESGMTDAERLTNLASETGAAFLRAYGSSASKDVLQNSKDIADYQEKRLELTKAAGEINEKNLREDEERRNKSEREREAASRKYQEEAEREHKLMDEVWKINREITKEREKQARLAEYDKGQKTLDRAERIRMTPSERAAIRRSERAEKRSIRRAAEEEVDEVDRALRRRGGSGMTPKQRREAINRAIRRAEDAKNKDKLEVKFAPNEIQMLTEKINELIAK